MAGLLLATDKCVLTCTPPTATVTGKAFATIPANSQKANIVSQIQITAITGQGSAGVIQSIIPGTISGSTQFVKGLNQSIVRVGDNIAIATVELPPGSPTTVSGSVTVTVTASGQTAVTGI